MRELAALCVCLLHICKCIICDVCVLGWGGDAIDKGVKNVTISYVCSDGLINMQPTYLSLKAAQPANEPRESCRHAIIQTAHSMHITKS